MTNAFTLRAEGLSRIYSGLAGGRGPVEVFRDLSFEVSPGEMVAIIGESGSGKSSLLHLLAALDRPSDGQVWYGKQRLDLLTPNAAASFRNREVGFVWQFHHLLPEFTAQENVALPLLARGTPHVEAMLKARAALEQVALADRLQNRSGELSGGEQQRVSLARALVTQPKLLLADEPTGDLDERTAESVFGLILAMHRQCALTTVLVTHHIGFAARCDRVLCLREGRLHPA